MKKFWTAAIVLLTALCGALGFAACGETVSSHTEHTFGEWTIVRQATCLEEGSRERVCTECSFKETDSIPVDKTKHLYDEGKITVEPTCSAAGERTLTCTVCKETKTEIVEIDPDAHEWDNGQVTTPPTCSATGVKTFTCLHNGQHQKTESIEKNTSVHRWNAGEVTKAATCSETGVKTFTCLDCSATRTEDVDIDQDAHEWDAGQVTTQPTCSAAGQKTYTCNHNPAHKSYETLDIEPTAHKWSAQGEVTKKATCSETGTMTYTCEYDPEHKHETVIDIDQDAHEWDAGQVTTQPTCSAAGQKTYTCNHNPAHKSYETLDIDQDAHEWDAGQVTTQPTCSAAGQKTYTCNHNPAHKSYEEVAIEPTAHKWSAQGEVTKKATCSETGTMTYTCEYDPEHKHETVIDIDQDAHEWDAGQVTTQPTCSAVGQKTYTCNHNPAHKSYEEVAIDQDAHEWDAGQVTTQPTCSAAGQKTYTCNHNPDHKSYETLDIEPTAHKWSAQGEVTKKATCSETGTMTYTCEYDPEHKHETVIDIDQDAHDLTEHTEVKAQCLVDGNKHYWQCNDCKKYFLEASAKENVSREDTVLEHPGHDWDQWVIDRPATCVATGLQHRSCKNCEEEQNDVSIPEDKENGHQWDSGEFTTLMDCRHDGVKHFICELCEQSKDENVPSDPDAHVWGVRTPNNDGTHDRTCTVCETEEPATDCSYEDIFHPATCTENSYTTHTCTYCGYRAPDTVNEGSKLNHSYGNDYIPDGKGGHYRICLNAPEEESHYEKGVCAEHGSTDRVDADCDTDGYEKVSCTLCHYEISNQTLEKTGHDFQNGRVERSPGSKHHVLHCAHNDEHTSLVECTFSKEDVTEPTCTDPGFTTHTCAVCGDSYTDGHQDARGHDWDTTYIAVYGDFEDDYAQGLGSPTNGRHYRTCTRCDERNEEDCEYGETGVRTAPTCSKEGYTTYTCEKCGHKKLDDREKTIPHTYVYKNNGNGTHDVECLYCKGEYGDSSPNVPCGTHMKAGASVPSTCVTKGYTPYTCELCGYNEQREVQELAEHTYQGGFKPDPARPGYHTRTCTVERCGYVDTQECGLVAGEVKKPTCTQPGNTEYTCECGYVKYGEEQPATGHQYPSTWLPVENYGKGNAKHYHLCTECHEREEQDCTGTHDETTDSTCYQAGHKDTVCDLCSGRVVEELDLLDHTWGGYVSKKEEGHYRVCTVEACHAQEPVQQHRLKDASDLPTCDTPGDNKSICEDCGYIEDSDDDLPALGHKYDGPWIYDTANPGHHYRVCIVCRTYRDEQECTPDTVTTDATCLKAEERTHTCNLCSNVTTETVGKPLGHDYGDPVQNDDHRSHTKKCIRANCDGTDDNTKSEQCPFEGVETDPTCTVAGYITYTCPECGNSYVQENVKEKIEHTYPQKWVSNNDKTHYRDCLVCGDRQTGSCANSDSTSQRRATCTSGGYTFHLCTLCNYTYRTNEQPARGHSYIWRKSATNGKHYRICQNGCGSREPEVACEYDVVEVIGDCNNPGSKTYTCKKCGYSYVDMTSGGDGHQWVLHAPSTDNKYHTMRCSVCGTEKQAECSYNEEAFPGTCTANGYHIHTCSVCLHSYRHEVENTMTNHVYSSWQSNGVESKQHTSNCVNCGAPKVEDCTNVSLTYSVKTTCEVSGYETYTCNDCGGTYTVSSGTAAGHQWGYSQSLGPQRTEHAYSCKVCYQIRYENCTYEYNTKDATCTENGQRRMLCTTCGNLRIETIEKLGHDYSDSDWAPDGTGQHSRACHRCRSLQVETCVMVDITDSPATCTKPGMMGKVCKYCSYSKDVQEYGGLGHNWSAWEPTGDGKNHIHHCLNTYCGESVTEPCNLSVSTTDRSCTTPESRTTTCSTCGYKHEEITEQALGHDWKVRSSDVSKHESYCARCETVSNEKHDYSGSNLCAVCGYDGLLYELVNDSYYIVRSDNDVLGAKNILIPATHDNKAVLGIDKHAFFRNEHILTVQLPRCLQFINYDAFFYCGNLQSVSFAEGETEIALNAIEREAFSKCTSLSSFPFAEVQKLTTIGVDCFYNCSALKGVSIPDTLVHLGGEAFFGTGHYLDRQNWKQDGKVLYIGRHLIKVDPSFRGEIELEEDTVSIGEAAFEKCTGISSLTIHNKVTFIDNDAFKDCGSILKLEYAGSLSEWLSIKFGNDLSSPLPFAEYFHITEVSDDPQIPTKDVSTIPAGTFANNADLTTINIPENITSIGAYAFYGCKNLDTIVLPDSVTYIGEHAFDGCEKLLAKQENWEKGVFYVGKHAIKADNDRIAQEAAEGKIELREDTITIVARAFMDCSNLKEVRIPKTVVYIGEQAFANSGLKKAVFEGASNDPTAGVQFFCSSYYQLVGRWFDDDLYDPTQAAQLITGLYQGYWRRTRAAN